MQSGLATAAVNEIWGSGNNLANFYAFLIQNPQLSLAESADIFRASGRKNLQVI